MSAGFRGGAGLGWLLGRLKLDGGIVARSLPVLAIKQAFANSAVAFTAMRISIQHNAGRRRAIQDKEGDGSLFLDCVKNNVSQAHITTSGFVIANNYSFPETLTSPDVTIPGLWRSTATVQGGTGYGFMAPFGAPAIYFGNTAVAYATDVFGGGGSSAVKLGIPEAITFGPAYSYANDTYLFRDAANVFNQRNLTNGQIWRWSRTHTDTSNYERVSLNLSSNTFILGPEAAGTGTLRPLYLRTATTTVASLAAAATVGAGTICHVTDATATTARSTVAGGGANFVQVMSDGTNWLIVA